MSLAIHPLNLGEVEVDFSFVAWGTNQGRRLWIPTTAYLITGAEAPIVVDASFRDAAQFTAASGVPARRSGEQTLVAQLAGHDLEPADVGYLVNTHLHHDHTGLIDEMPNAKILVQRAELQYAAAPLFPFPFYDRVDVPKLVGASWDRVELLDGDEELFPGIRAVVTGGHSPAHQVLYVDVPSGTAIVAGDVAYRVDVNVKRQVPMGYFVSLEDVMAALRRVARDGDHVLPSHDSAVYDYYPNGIE
jgi:glyoxylase-like metal-dependent hydrolase (beta-lactamase superfamily II)